MSTFSHRLVETTPPAAEPVSLEEAKAHLRVGHNADDTLIGSLITTARQLCESMTGLALINRNYSLFLDRWPASAATAWWDGVRDGAMDDGAEAIALPRPPLASVGAIVVHGADDGETAIDPQAYDVDTAGKPGRVALRGGFSAPVSPRAVNGIEIRYVAGFGASASSVPAVLKLGIKQIVAHLYAERGDDPATAVQKSGASALFLSYRVLHLP